MTFWNKTDVNRSVAARGVGWGVGPIGEAWRILTVVEAIL